jgi:hypothetical protein
MTLVAMMVDSKSPLSDVESRTNLTPETMNMDVVALCFAKGSLLMDTYAFQVYMGVR